jgi:hypothetical protein
MEDRSMIEKTKTVQARKTGNARVFTIPTFIHVDEGKEYSVFQGRDGIIIYAPKLGNIFTDAQYSNVDFKQEEVAVGALTGNEIVDA